MWQFSNRPFGYERIHGSVAVVEHEAEVIREAYSRFLAGETLYGIVDSLNLRGLATTSGRPWSVSTLSARLSNPAYAGIRMYKGEEVAVGDWEAIVPRETWEAYKNAKQRRRKPDSWTNRAKYLLSGIATCAVCGSKMLARPVYGRTPETPVRTAYACTTNWCVQRNQERLDDLVEAIVIARLSKPDAARLLRPKTDVAPLLKQADELRRLRDDLASALAEGLLTLAAVREESRKLTKRLEGVEVQISAANDESGLGELVTSGDVEGHWRNNLTLSKKRAVIAALLTVSVKKQANTRVFDPDDVRISWKETITE